MHTDPALQELDAHYQAMPPVAALQLRIAGFDGDCLRLQQAGLAAEVYVADSSVRYRAPLYADLEAEAWLDGGESWDAVCTALREQGRARVFLQACVRLRDGGIAAEGRARFVAIARAGPDATGSVMAQGTG
jgi:thioesterase domain-containing protein